MDIVAEDGARAFEHLEELDDDDPEDWAAGMVGGAAFWHQGYTPTSFWDDQDVYLEMLVEKIDPQVALRPHLLRVLHPHRQRAGMVRPEHPMGDARANPRTCGSRSRLHHPLLRRP